MNKHKKEYIHPQADVVELAQQSIMAGSIKDEGSTLSVTSAEEDDDVEFD